MKKVFIAAPIKNEFQKEIETLFADCEILWGEDLSAEERKEGIANCDALLASKLITEMNEEEKALLDKPKFVQTLMTGVDHLDFSKLPENIPLHSNAGGWAEGIAESVLGMILAVNRCLREQTAALGRGIFDKPGYPLKNLKDQKILILGFGGIGQACAKILAPFGMKISAISHRLPKSELLENAYTMESLHEALKETDILLLAVPLTKETRGIIGEKELSFMKKDATIVNVARAGLIDKEAIEKHVAEHPTFHLAMDVWWKEFKNYPAEGEKILQYPNVIGSTHNSELSSSALGLSVKNAISNVRNFLDGKPTFGKINKDLYRK